MIERQPTDLAGLQNVAAPQGRPVMQTFRAYLQDDAGALTWAAWIDAAHLSEAVDKAQALCGPSKPTVEAWSVTDRRPDPASILDPI